MKQNTTETITGAAGMRGLWSEKRQGLLRTARALIFGGLGFAATSQAALLNLTDTPLFLANSVDPNIVLTFDDSGSMSWGYLPDDVYSLADTRRGCSSTVNKVYYDPNVTYLPGVDENGNSLGNASFTNAWKNGYDKSAGTVDLSTSYQATWAPSPYSPEYASCGTGTTSGQAAYYYVYDPAGTGCSPASTTKDACYRLVQHGNLAAGGAWSAAQQQNFANWYSYYRTRTLLAKTAAGRAFSRLSTSVRVAGQHLNNNTTSSSTPRFTTTIGLMKKFEGSNRADFFTRLYNSPASGSTPLREAMKRAGDYFSGSGTNSPYRDEPGNSSSPERSCRQNFHVLFTDGYWNSTAGVSGNIDGNAQTFPDGKSYDPASPPPYIYRDSASATLADNAFYYWYRDLRPDLTNNVPTYYSDRSGTADENYWNPVNDPANWQHMVNYTIGLGIDGTLPFNQTTYNSLLNGSLSWPDATANSPTAVDDLWHAAINSRGRYFSASNPTDLINAFTAAITSVTERTASASAVALNSGSLLSNTFVYQARFNSGDWTGQLLAYAIDPKDGSIANTPSWDSARKLNQQHYDTGRTILTYHSDTRQGIPFRWLNLSSTQKTALNFNPVTGSQDPPGAEQGETRLNYLRGDASQEGTNNYRVRARLCGSPPQPCPSGTNTGVLGDIIHSAPLYVGRPPYDYQDAAYVAFRNTYKNRTPIIYVGANDGMLHGFDANTGAEKIAYVPSKVYGNLSRLTANNYAHRYYVDGTPTANDVVIGNAWRTVLVSGLRKGGQGVFALDITDPSQFSEGNAQNLVLWEFNDSDDNDLGYTFSDVSIVKMANGKWAAVFGNGYNNTEPDSFASTSGEAVLYIVFMDGPGADKVWNNGTEYVKLATGAGCSPNCNTGKPNGLASPAPVDVDGDGIIDYIYAGDLQGNMWKWDVRSSTPSDWSKVSNRSLVWQARDASNKAQPITSRPQVGRHPAGLTGYMVYFGTGKYLEGGTNGDGTTAGATTQTFYGIWDGSGANSPSRKDLLKQEVLDVKTVNGVEYRITSDNPITWRTGNPPPSPSYIGWYIDMPKSGEKVVTNPVLRGDRIIFTTLIPSDDPCQSGGEGWLMELRASNGGRLTQSPFDVTGDGTISDEDLLISNATGSNPVAVSGRKSTGIPSAPTILVGGPPNQVPGQKNCAREECKYISTSAGTIETVTEKLPPNYRRNSWRQIR